MILSKIQKSLLVLIFIFYPCSANAQIKSKEKAQEFLHEYCIEIVGAIQDAYTIQKKSATKGDWKTFGEKGRWIGALADVYSKICK